MGYGLKRLLEIEKAKKERKAERERIKKEKEEAKLREKKALRKKKLRAKANKRAYAKRRKVQLEEREKKGDEYGYYMVLITKNNKRVERVGAAWWKTDAYKIYNDAIEENEKTVKMPVEITSSHTDNVRKNNKHKVKYEIIMVRKLNAPEEDDLITQFRDKNGKFIDHKVIDSDEHVIIAKHDWLIDETFHVYGFHPEKDRKKYDFILNEIVLHNYKDKYDSRQILTYHNKVLIKYLDDFDFVICKTASEAKRLYNILEKEISNMKIPYIMFMGEIGYSQKTEWINRIEEKTGWPRDVCKKPTLI